MYRNTIITLALTSLLYVVTAVITTLVSDRVFPGKDQQDRNVLASAMTGCNSAFMGFPIASAIFGELVFYYMVIQNISNNLYLFVMSLVQLHHREKVKSLKSLREKLQPLANPTSVATILSIILLFAGLHLPAYVMDIVDPSDKKEETAGDREQISASCFSFGILNIKEIKNRSLSPTATIIRV